MIHLYIRDLRMLFSGIITLTFLPLCNEIMHVSPQTHKSQNRKKDSSVAPPSGSTRLSLNISYSQEELTGAYFEDFTRFKHHKLNLDL